MTRILMVAGERSGDSHGSALIQALQAHDSDLSVLALGGPLMAAAGAQLHADLTQYAIIGFTGVLRVYPQLRKLALDTVAALKSDPPDAVVLIDYPGFNLRFAQLVAPLKIPIIYYITPQVWAWNRKRKYLMARTISLALNILPFEPEIFREVGLPARYVGNPLVAQVHTTESRQQVCARLHLDPMQPIIGLLPGSRRGEVRRILPELASTARLLRDRIPHAQCVLVTSSSVPDSDYSIMKTVGVEYLAIAGPAFNERAAMDMAFTASGTATLENGLLNTPTVVVYRVSALNAFLARRLIEVPFLSLVNLIGGREIFPEFMQQQMSAPALATAAEELLLNKARQHEVRAALATVRDRLGQWDAGTQAAQAIIDFLRTRG